MPKRHSTTFISLYGSIAIQKRECPLCGHLSFFIEGKTKCCGAELLGTEVERVKRESGTVINNLNKKQKYDILELQYFKCIYCGINLKEKWFYLSGGRYKRITTDFDHFIPRNYAVINQKENIYASCSLCNRVKQAKMFDTLDECRFWIVEQRKLKGTMEVYNEIELSTM